MSKHIQLSIPTPCHEDWNKMTPVEKGKFCGSCQKQVIDFSNMSDREIATFFKKKSTGSVCGRFMEDQLDRSIEIPKKRIPWVKYFFQFVLPAFLVSMKATAQGKVKVTKLSGVNQKSSCSKLTGTVGMVLPDYKPIPKGDTVINLIQKSEIEPIKKIVNAITNTSKEITTSSIQIKGKVMDSKDLGIPNVVVAIKGTKIATLSDIDGNFVINVDRKQSEIILVASYVGFETIEKVVDLSSDLEANIELRTNPVLAGVVEVLVMDYAIRKKIRPELKTVPLLSKIKQTPFKFFRLYPNPINTNTSLNIEWRKAEIGNYVSQLFNESGQLIYSKEMYIDNKARILNIQLPLVPAGNYFIRMTNKKSGKSYTEKIVVQ